MGFQPKGVPYKIFFGLNLSYEKHNLDNSLFDSYLNVLEEIKFDYAIANISVKDQGQRREKVKTRPIFVNELLFKTSEWNDMFASKLHLHDLESPNNLDLILQDINFSNHLNAQYVYIDYSTLFNQSNFYHVNKLLRTITSTFDKNDFYIALGMDRDSLNLYNKLISMCGYPSNLGVILKMGETVPEKQVIDEWLSHNVKGIQFPVSFFVKGLDSKYNYLQDDQEACLVRFLSREMDVILEENSNVINFENVSLVKNFVNYIENIFSSNYKKFSEFENMLFGFRDYFQSPLQPLRDNLESKTYEYFEEDQTKYEQYYKALVEAFKNYNETNYLKLSNVDKVRKGEMPKGELRVINACVLGAGRGPLVRKLVLAGRKENVKLRCILMEKNVNAFNTLLNLKSYEEDIFGQVEMIFGDIRDWNPDFKIDIVISELLGSFGDNELSPECLINVEKFLSEDSIMIPAEYTSYIRPVTCLDSWIQNKSENLEIPYVVLPFKAFYPIKETKQCFTFSHPNQDKSGNLFSKFVSQDFIFPTNAIIHGFMGYFDSNLYGKTNMSIRPENHTDNMASWFPLYFPIFSPLEVKESQKLTININRENDGKKVWYEWNCELENGSMEMKASKIHNFKGSQYAIEL